MSNSIWKTPDQKPDVFKPHRILVIYEAHDEPELMFSPQYDTLTDHRYVNRWCYWDEFIAQADKAERLQEQLEIATKALKAIEWFCYAPTMGERAGRMQQCAVKALEQIEHKVKDDE